MAQVVHPSLTGPSPKIKVHTDKEIIEGCMSGDPIWRQAYDEASMEFLMRHAGQFVSTPSLTILDDVEAVMSNLRTDRPTAKKVQRELLDLTEQWYWEFIRQLEEKEKKKEMK